MIGLMADYRLLEVENERIYSYSGDFRRAGFFGSCGEARLLRTPGNFWSCLCWADCFRDYLASFEGPFTVLVFLIVGNTEDFALDTRFVSIPNGWIFQVESSLAVECFCRLDHFSEDRLRKVVQYCLCREFLGRV